MPSVAVLGPLAVPLIAASVIALFGLAGTNLGRVAAGVGAWGSVAALLAVWLPVRSSVELVLGQLGYGSSLDLRIDGVSFAFGLMITVPAALLLTIQPRTAPESALSLVGIAAALGAVEAGGVVLTAIAGGTAATVAVVLLDTEDADAPRPSWGLLLAGWLGLALVGVTLQVGGGTAVYSAVPVSAVTPALFVLLAASGLVVSGILPWRSWPARMWSRPSLRAAGVSLAMLFPLGFYLFVRAYELGDGRYPSPALHALLGMIGIAVALAAAARAQAAATRREFLAEVMPGFGGFALSAIALGSPLGLVAGVLTLAAASALVACLAMLPDRAGLAAVVTIAAAVGLPPGVTFGARVIGIGSTFEAGDLLGLIGVAAAIAWALWVVAGARAMGLPGGRGHPATETQPVAALAIALLTLVAGPALGLLLVVFANPVAAGVMQVATGGTGGLTTIDTVSSQLSVVTLFTPLLLIAGALFLLARRPAVRPQARPAIFPLPISSFLSRVRDGIRSATVPEQYRSILSPRELEIAAAGGRPVLWLVALVALAFAVTR